MTVQYLRALAQTLTRNSLASLPQPLARKYPAILLAALALLGAAHPRHAAAQAAKSPTLQSAPSFAGIPLSFEPNRGQTDPHVRFVSRGPGYALFLTPAQAVLQLSQPSSKQPSSPAHTPAPSSTLAMTLIGARSDAPAAAEDILPGTVNYFIGSDRSKWQTGLPTYKRVAFRGVYPGVDLVYYGNQRQLEYDFVVAPGADPAAIALSFAGATPTIDPHGDLVLPVANSPARFHKPVVYQMAGNRKVPVDARYQIAGGKVTFALAAFDHSKPLIIDPVLSYLTYLGGSTNDVVNGIAVDASGSAYTVASTNSIDFPVKNAYQGTNVSSSIDSRNASIAVTKFNSTGTALVYSTYIGGSDNSLGYGIAVDATGNAYIGGYTNSGDYPVTTGAFQTICGGNYAIVPGTSTGIRANGCPLHSTGDTAGVLTKLNPAGNALVYSTFFSGNNFNSINAVAVNSAGEAYVTGETNSFCGNGNYGPNGTGYQPYDCLPTTAGAVQFGVQDSTGGGTRNFGFFTKFDAAGATLIYSSLIGPTTASQSSTIPHTIAVDAAGLGYIAGTATSNLLTSAGSYQPSISGANGGHAFVAKFDPAAKKLVYSTFVTSATGTGTAEAVNGIAADASGNAYIAGATTLCTFPTTPGADQPVAAYPPGTATNCNAGFVSKLNPAGSALVWSTFVGNDSNSNNHAFLYALALGSDLSVYVAGQVNGGGFPYVGAVQTQTDYNAKALIVRLNPSGSAVLFATSLGGVSTSSESANAVAVDSAGVIYTAGQTNSFTLPVTPGAFQATNKTHGGNTYTGFVARIAPTLSSTTTLTIPSGTVTGGQPATFTAKVAGPAGSTVIPTGTVTFLNGSTTLGTGTLDATGKASYTAPSLNATTYNITASYAGDSTFAGSVSASQALVVAPATATVTLTAPASAIVGAPVNLAVTVSGTSGTPIGSVIFKDGANTLATVSLASGAASYTTSALAAGTHSITAVYSGDSIFGGATSAASTVNIGVAPTISFSASPTSLTLTHGTSGTVVITATPVGGYSGTVTFACPTLPTAAACTFAPSSLVFTGNNVAASTTLTFSTSMTTTGQLQSLPGFRTVGGIFAALLLMPFTLRRRGGLRTSRLLALILLIAGSASLLGVSGCSGGTKAPTTITTAPGVYTVPVTVTAGTNVSTLNLSITVQ